MSTWIYSNSEDNKNRFILGEKGSHPLICIVVNPSTAEPNYLDPTLKAVKRRVLSLGYDSWIMINLYPQRATNPNNLDKIFDSKIHQKNLEEISTLFSNANYDVWAAWGTLIEMRPYLINCLKKIHQIIHPSKSKWFTIGEKTINGHPHHPLYLKNDLSPDTFDIDQYLTGQTTKNPLF